jgi:hypothetical protein
MKSPAKCSAWLLPLLVSGCILHKTDQSHDLPYAPPIEAPVTLQVASLELPPKITVIPAQPVYNMPEQSVPIKPPVRHRRFFGGNGDENGNSDVAGNPPAVSAIGQLSSGASGDVRQQTEGSIAAIERGLNGINRQLDDSEQKTADHIREFIKQAKTALASGDVEGARTLAVKAKVLLDELSK